MAAESSADVVALVFSKDRAWQLHQTVVSLYEHCVGLTGVHVIFAASSEAHKDAYTTQFEQQGIEGLHMHDEAKHGFKDTLLAVTKEIARIYRHVIVAVDDLVFFRQVPVRSLSQGFKNSRLWCIHLKLDPCKEYCHPADSICIVPKLTARQHLLGSPFVTWPLLGRGTHDWRYPWDLCATLYRSDDLLKMMMCLNEAQPSALEHPNSLEAAGNTLLRSTTGASLLPPDALAGALLAPAATCITVNRVQDVYSNAIFENKQQSTSPDALVAWAGGNRSYDLRWYRQHAFNSVHIGHFQCAAAEPQSAEPLLIDVIIPMYNAENTIQDALASLVPSGAVEHVSSAAGSSSSSSRAAPLDVHLVLVDDGSSDASWDIALQALAHSSADLAQLGKGPRLPAAVEAVAEQACAGGGAAGFSWTAVQCKHNAGIACALNIALACTRAGAAYIARMDADDIAAPGRLGTQAAFMAANRLQLSGSSAMFFTDEAVQMHGVHMSGKPLFAGDYPLSRPACHPVLLAWDMLWGCALLHPTTMASAQWWRKADEHAVLHEADAARLPAVYRAAAVPAEDYDLWLRQAHLSADTTCTTEAAAASIDGEQQSSALVANIGTPLLWYRKGGAGGAREQEQRSKAAAAQLDAWNELLGGKPTVDTDVLSLLVGQGGLDGVSVATVLSAGAALVALHDAFLQAAGVSQPRPGSIAQQAAAAPSFSAVPAASLQRHISGEVQQRLSGLAMAAMAAMGPRAMPLLAQWRQFKAQHSGGKH